MTHQAPHITPAASGAERPCWHCRSFGGMVYQGTAALCLREGGTPIAALPRYGCAFWVREPGADDEPGPPPVCVTVRAPAAAAAAPRGRRTP